MSFITDDALLRSSSPEGFESGAFLDGTEQSVRQNGLSAQYAVTRVLAAAETLPGATPKILQALCEGLGWELAVLWRVDERARVLRCVDAWKSPAADPAEFEAVTREMSFAPGIGLPGRVWASGEPAWIDDVVGDPNFPRAQTAARAGLHAALGFPIVLGGRVLGVIEAFSRDVCEPDEDVLQTMGAVGSQIGQFIGRKETEEAVRESEARKSAIVESVLDCVVTMDRDGRVVEFNPAAERTFGYARGEVVGRQMAELIIPPSLREAHYRGLERHLETGHTTYLGRRVETTAMRSDGSEFPVELAITRVDWAGPPLFTGFIRDITDRKSADEERGLLLTLEQKARGEAESARARLEFLAEASELLAGSLLYRDTLAKVARLTVPRLADWSIIFTLDDGGNMRWLESAHGEADKERVLQEVWQRYLLDPRWETLVTRVMETGVPQLVPEVSGTVLETAPVGASDLEVVESLRPRSAMIVPLVARGRALGAMALMSAESARTFGPEDLRLASDLARRAALAMDNARLYEERTYIARTLQRSLLPPTLPDVPGIDIAARYRSAGEGTEVGGDFYDVFETGDGAWGVVIGDVCGKGADAAALTGLARHTLRATAMTVAKPTQVLVRLNNAMTSEISESQFCTVAYARLETCLPGTRLTAASGGHPCPLVLRSDGLVERLECAGMVLGAFTTVVLGDISVDLDAGDAVVFYTDGVTDAPRDGAVFGEGRLMSVLSSCRGRSAAAIADEIERAVVDFQDTARDDMALLVLRVAA